MFTESCKRLRIMKSSEAIGLGKADVCYIKNIDTFFIYVLVLLDWPITPIPAAPRAMEKYKSRN
jgi:hypothetical protein